MRRELETSLDDEHLRSAVLLRFPRAQSRARVFRLALQRIFRFRERLWCQMQERQLVGLNCLCDTSHVPTVRGTTQKYAYRTPSTGVNSRKQL